MEAGFLLIHMFMLKPADQMTSNRTIFHVIEENRTEVGERGKFKKHLWFYLCFFYKCPLRPRLAVCALIFQLEILVILLLPFVGKIHKSAENTICLE